MPSRIILLSGHVCAGKSTLARALHDRFGTLHVKTGDCLVRFKPEIPRERKALQEEGERLDCETNGAWVIDALRMTLEDAPEEAVVVLDCVRIPGQIEAVRRGYGNRVYHVHLRASIETLSDRYKSRTHEIKEFDSYDEVMKNPTEAAIDRLADEADVAISSERCSPADVLTRAASHAGLFGRSFDRVVDVIIGGQFGSEGKGQVAAYLAPEYDVLVRVGGPNAGHTVWQHPAPYTYHHLPSGTGANANAHLVIGPGAVLFVPRLMKEIAECEVDVKRLSIDPQAMLISEEDRRAEKILQAAMGSTAQGVGEATARRILGRGKPRAECSLAENEPLLRPYLRSTCEVLDRHFHRGAMVMLEGTQGTGLSLYHGQYPYVTSRDTTVAGCLSDAGISPSRVGQVIMVCRTYPIRVESPVAGTSGPMGIELDWATISERSGIPLSDLEATEKTSTTKRKRRVAEFNWELLRRSASLNAPTDIALTFADYITRSNQDARRFEQLSDDTRQFVDEIERVANSPVSLISTRFHSRGIIDRRGWQRIRSVGNSLELPGAF